MNKWLNRLFGFTKKEQNGLIVLVLLICLAAFLPSIYKAWFPPDVYVVDLPAQEENQRGKENMSQNAVSARRRDAGHSLKSSPAPELFPFNPNGLPAEQWRRLGLTDRQIRVIYNYESKGGSFRRKEDLKKMYSISEERYRAFEPYITIPEMTKSVFRQDIHHSAGKSLSVTNANRVVDLNAADSATLLEVRGIGPVLASRILQYRSRLGGFRSVDQLREVYGIDSLRFQEIFTQLSVDTSAISKIHINRVGFDELKKFPYLRYKQMNAIIQYRKQHGRYSSVEDLTKINILDREILRKIAPYLIFDD